MRKTFFFFFIICAHLTVNAQDLHMKSIDNLGKYPADLIIKLAPLSLIDFKQSLQVAVEYKIKPRTTFQNEIGYINNLLNLYTYDDYRNMKGLRTRFEIRFYQKNFFDYVSGFYIAPEIFYVYTNYQRIGELGRGCLAGRCDYFERKKFTVHKDVFGYHFKVGYQRIANDRILFDFYGGAGLRHVFIHSPDTETEQDFFNEQSDLDPLRPYNNGTFLRPSFSLGMKIGYLLK
ncbi:MAG: DUF3575 domain-containing protein [Bacteroidota bacterium]|nr:DUF3575 domain-containing protein [Bacteroidota bacterium]